MIRSLFACVSPQLRTAARQRVYRNSFAVFVFLFFLWLPLGSSAREHAELPGSADAVVVSCFDGDTVKLRDRRIVRLVGIDTPERGKKGQNPQYYAREATDLLEQLVRGKRVTLEVVSTKAKDRYGRILAVIRLENGESVNERLVREGVAFVYPHKNVDSELLAQLKTLQVEAITERRGMWPYILSLPSAQTTFVGNKNSSRFYPSEHADVQKIKPRNRIFFGNLMDAFMAGYSPARTSGFWPAEKD